MAFGSRVGKEPLGEMLVRNGVISPDMLRQALEKQKEHPRRRLGEILVSLEFVAEATVAAFLGSQIGIPYVVLSEYNIQPEVGRLIPMEEALDKLVLPIDRLGARITLAMADPLDDDQIQELAARWTARIKPVIATRTEIVKAVGRLFSLTDQTVAAHLSGGLPPAEAAPAAEETPPPAAPPEPAPVPEPSPDERIAAMAGRVEALLRHGNLAAAASDIEAMAAAVGAEHTAVARLRAAWSVMQRAQDAGEEQMRRQAEEAERQRQAEEAERQRLEAEAAEQARLQAEAEAEARRQAEEAERQRQAEEAEAAEHQRLAALAAEQARAQAEEAERAARQRLAEEARLRAEEAARLEAEAAQQQLREAEEARQRQQAAEQARAEAFKFFMSFVQTDLPAWPALADWKRQPENKVATLAVLGLIHSPFALYNPLLITGPAGAGKTFLAQAAARALAEKNPAIKPARLSVSAWLAAALESGRAPEQCALPRAADWDPCALLILDDLPDEVSEPQRACLRALINQAWKPESRQWILCARYPHQRLAALVPEMGHLWNRGLEVTITRQ